MSAAAGERPVRAARSVPIARVGRWYSDGMHLFKRAPAMFVALAFVSLATEFALNAVPLVGGPLADMVVPLVGCGLLYASLAADRGQPARLRFALAAFAASPSAVAAVILASVLVLLAEAAVAARIGGVNLLDPSQAADLSAGAVVAVFLIGVAVSLPLTFVPFFALFDGESVRASFRASFAAFVRNPVALLLYGAVSFLLLLLGIVTSGIGLLLALPLWASSSYAAWKDIFEVDASRG